MRPHSRGILVVAVALVLAAAADSDACTCMQNPAACQAVWENAAVFVGDVINIEDSQQSMRPDGPMMSRRRVQVRIAESFRGDVSGVVEVSTGKGGGDCGFPFVVGQRYLVYATQSPLGYQTGICQRTRLVNEADEDLAYLRSMSRVPAAMAAITGTVVHVALDLDGHQTVRTPFAGARIEAEADGRRYEALSGRDGRYSMPVPTGTYRVKVEVPEQYYVQPGFRPRDAVLVRDVRGCASVDIFVQANGRIAGRILDANGGPIAGLTIEAQSVRPPTFRSRGLYTPTSTLALTNGQGEYELAALHPGEYTVGIYAGRRLFDRDPDERILVNGVAGTDGSRIISIAPGQRLVLDDFAAPSMTIAQVVGVVRFPDGRPAAGARVYLYAESVPNRILNEPAAVDADGRFSLTVVAGRRYKLIAEFLPRNQPRRPGDLMRAETPAFEAAPALTPLDIRLLQK